MTSERTDFPIGLTLASLIAFAICCGLGVWQMQRADWKAGQLKLIAAARTAPPLPIAMALGPSGGPDVSYRRVTAVCLPQAPAPIVGRVTSDNNDWVTRAISFCPLAGTAYEGVWVDRGFVGASRGSTTPAQLTLPAPVNVVGVLSHTKGDCFGSDGCAYWFGHLLRPAPYVLVAERETPPAPGVTPAPYANAEDNLQYVGAYTLTWFGLAGTLAAVYAAMLWRRYRPKR